MYPLTQQNKEGTKNWLNDLWHIRLNLQFNVNNRNKDQLKALIEGEVQQAKRNSSINSTAQQ